MSNTAAVSRSSTAPTASAPARTPGRHGIEQSVIAGIARVRATEVAEIEQAVRAGGGDLELDSQEGVTVIAKLERELDRKLPGPAKTVAVAVAVASGEGAFGQ